MRYVKNITFLCFGFLAIIPMLNGQDVPLNNGSFEDEPRLGTLNYGYATPPPRGWFDCSRYIAKFKSETPPDIHPSENTPFFEVTIPPSHGETYLGLVVRANESWESVSQLLEVNLVGGQCYEFSIDLVRSKTYWSQIIDNGSEEIDVIRNTNEYKIVQQSNGFVRQYNHTTPAVLRVWGGSTVCGEGELLAVSKPINNTNWNRYTFKIQPKFDIAYITLSAFYNVPILVPYLGHILVDNASSFVAIDCNTPEELVASIEEVILKDPDEGLPIAEAEIEKEIKKVEESKQNNTVEKANPTNPVTPPKKDAVADAESLDQPESEEKILKELDRKKIKTGQVIQIKNLQFEADKYVINTDSYKVIFEIYDFLEENETVEIEIGGHTNGMPPHNYCDNLSRNRAQAVADFLIEKGIASERIEVKGYGKRKPKFSNKTPLGRQKNQRVEIKILKVT